MKKKALSFMLSAILFLSAFTTNTSAVQTELENYLSSLTEEEKIIQKGVFSSEYQSSPFYEKLITALDDSKNKTTMEKALSAALSQEGYQNYSLDGADISQAKTDGLIWTGIEQRMNDNDTGNTEYTRWAQSCVMDRNGEALYIDCDWCAIFMSWCMYQAGYYTEDRLKQYYYSYCADPRVEYAADTWIEAFCLEQENVWYTSTAAKKLEAYSWNTYYHTETDPCEIPYKPGGLVFFSWDGEGRYFEHVGMVINYDSENHILTYIGGNTEGQVMTRKMALDTVEEFHKTPLLKNSERIMAYGEYDEVKPLEQKEITANYSEIIWDKSAGAGIKIQTNSASKIASVSIDGEYLGSNIESNMVFNEGRLAIGKSELVNLPTGEHTLMLTFDDGVVEIPFKITDVENEEREITAEHTSIDWERSAEDIVIKTNSESETVEIRIGGGLAGNETTDGITLENGTVTLSGEFANTILEDDENTLRLIFGDGEIEITVFVTSEPKTIIAEHTNITWGRSGESIVINTDSESDTVAIRIGGGLAGNETTDGITLENGTVTLSGEFANTILEDGENTLRLIFGDGEIEISIFVTSEPKAIMAEHTNITWGRSGESIVIKTNSESDTVAIRIGGGLAGNETTEGITLENGTVTLSGEFANTILEDGENTLRLIFADGEIEISIFVTHEVEKEESSDLSVPQISDNTDTPKTGESYPFFIIPIFVLSGFIVIFVSKKRNPKDIF